MLRSTIASIVAFCAQRAWWVIVVALSLGTSSAFYTARHFSIKTDVNDLFSPSLPWTKRAFEYMRTFPQYDILIVVNAPSPEFVEQATDKLALALATRTDVVRDVREPQSGKFFKQNALLFLPTSKVAAITDELARAAPLFETLAADPSLGGTLDALALGLMGVERGELNLDAMSHTMRMASDTLEMLLAGRPTSFSWQVLANGTTPERRDLYRFIQVEPLLNFSTLEPGRAVTDAIAKTASDLELGTLYQARVRQTGQIPINDDKFSTLKEHAGINLAGTVLSVLIILWLALRSARIILAVFTSLAVGLAVSAGVGLWLVGAFNLISLAFFALFIGLGVDFSIQFGVRYRAERHEYHALRAALVSAGKKAGAPLALAAAGTAIGFSSFFPTAYRGLSELGEIAGSGMIIAFVTGITLLPALLTVLSPPNEPRSMGFAALAPVDHFVLTYRVPIVAATLGVVFLASPLLWFLPVDFNPTHLQSASTESVATFLELRKDPQTGASAIEVITSNISTANATARRLGSLSQVSQTMTLSDLIPSDQDQKLKLIADAAREIEPVLNRQEVDPPRTDQDNIEALSSTADSLSKVAGTAQGTGADAARTLASLLSRLAKGDPAVRKQAEVAVSEPLRVALDKLRNLLRPQRVTLENIPADIARDWITADGRARVQVLPKGDPEDTTAMRSFVTAVLAAEPQATGPAVMLYEARNTIVQAFVQAGIFALSAIAMLLWVVLRRLADVLLTLVPLLVAGVVTLELCVILDLPLNFANIIALPLLLGVGVAFKIYYVLAWRTGKTMLVQSSLTRAVIFSAMTTAIAFGSLWLSPNPGISSMGKLMALALVSTMAAAVLFQPALMGPPRNPSSPRPQPPTEPG
jgi:hopanoid biosynthesis associated RND transporter like protein HpnN